MTNACACALGWVPGRTSREVPLSAMAAQPPAQGLLVPGTVTESRSNCQYARRVTFTLRPCMQENSSSFCRASQSLGATVNKWHRRLDCERPQSQEALREPSEVHHMCGSVTSVQAASYRRSVRLGVQVQ